MQRCSALRLKQEGVVELCRSSWMACPAMANFEESTVGLKARTCSMKKMAVPSSVP